MHLSIPESLYESLTITELSLQYWMRNVEKLFVFVGREDFAGSFCAG